LGFRRIFSILSLVFVLYRFLQIFINVDTVFFISKSKILNHAKKKEIYFIYKKNYFKGVARDLYFFLSHKLKILRHDEFLEMANWLFFFVLRLISLIYSLLKKKIKTDINWGIGVWLGQILQKTLKWNKVVVQAVLSKNIFSSFFFSFLWWRVLLCVCCVCVCVICVRRFLIDLNFETERVFFV